MGAGPGAIWSEARKSLTQTLRESLTVSSRAASLIIDKDSIENPLYYRTSSNN